MKKFRYKLISAIFAIVAGISCAFCLYSSNPNLAEDYYDFGKTYPCVFVDLKSEDPIEFTKLKGGVLYFNNDSANKRVIQFYLRSKQDDTIQVIAREAYPTGGLLHSFGAISSSAPLRVFVKGDEAYNGDFDLYTIPVYNTDYKRYANPGEAKVVDVDGKWLKIEFESDGVKVQGWIPWEEQCGNPYSSCHIDEDYVLRELCPGAFLDLSTEEQVEFIKEDGKAITISNDTIKHCFVGLTIIEKKGNYFRVRAWSECDSSDGDGYGIGLIPDTASIHIFLKGAYGYSYTDDVNLYSLPFYNSDFKRYPYFPEAKVIDVNGQWLKIEFESDGVKVQGWIPREEQCPSIWTTCC